MRQRMLALVLATAGLLISTGAAPASAAEDYLTSPNSGNGCLAPLWGSREPGAYIGYERCDNTKTQAWRRADKGGGWYTYQSLISDLCLTVLNGSNGADVVQQPCADTPSQRWKFVQRDPIAVAVEVRSQVSDLCLTAGQVQHSTPSDVVVRTCFNIDWQKWAPTRWEPPAS
ncbi:RICIN domain-containing protein [Crossiella sp. CA198]